jgi:hypothetical protein
MPRDGCKTNDTTAARQIFNEQQLNYNNVNTEAEDSPMLEAITRKRLVASVTD